MEPPNEGLESHRTDVKVKPCTVIRLASKSDLLAIYELGSSGLGFTRPLEDLRRELASPQTMIAVLTTRDDSLLGYLNVWIGADELEVTEIVVSTQYRRQGYGRELIAWLMSRRAQMGACRIHLEVRASNHPAISLYSAMGFVEVGRRRGYYRDGEDAYLYSFSVSDEGGLSNDSC